MAKNTVNATQQIDDYLAGLPAPTKAICTRLREIILSTSPDITEEWRWGPSYSYQGMLCGYGGFQKHAKFTFFNGAGMTDREGVFNHCVDNEFSRSVKFTDVSEINEKQLRALIKDSMATNKKGFKRVVKDKTVEVPKDLQKALAKSKKAKAFFEGLSYGYQKETIQWLDTAKRAETRADRVQKSVQMFEEGKRLNDKYR